MIGRDAEQAVLAEALAELAAGRGRSVLVQGEPGIGKSALAAAALAGADHVGVEVLRGGCDELGRRFPLSVMLAALRVAEDSSDSVRAEAAAALSHPGAPSGERQPPVAGGDAAAAAIERLAELVDRLCAARPVVLLVDDLQWADEPSLLLWTQLSRAAAQLPLLLIGLCRPTPRPAELDALREELAGAEHGLVLGLEPLGAAEVARLAGRLAGGEPGPEFTRLLESAAGNPLYVREIVDALARSGTLTVADGVAEPALMNPKITGPAGSVGPTGSSRPTGPASQSGPAKPTDRSVVSLAGAIADRLDFLSPQCRTVLQAAALRGAEVTAEDVSELASIPAQEVLPMFVEAAEAGVVAPVGRAVRFRHGLIRQALYESMPEALRVAMYRDAAQHLIRSGAPVERTAEAVLRALDVADGWELDWLARNAESLVHRAPTIAVELIEHSLAHVDRADAGAQQLADRLEDQLAHVFFLMGRYEDTERLTRRILRGHAEPERYGWAAWLLGYSLLRNVRLDEALDLLAEVRTTALWQARLTVLRAMIFNRGERAAEARGTAEEALALGEKLGDVLTIGYALHTLALRSVVESDQASSLAHLDRALAVIESERRLDDLRMLLLSNRAVVLDTLDRYDDAVDSLRRAYVIGEKVGTSRVSMLRVMTSTQAFNRGYWDDALAELDALSTLGDFADIPVVYHGMCALIAAHRDDAETLARHLHELDTGGDSGWASSLGAVIVSRALAAERDGRLRDALEILDVSVDPEDTRFHETRADWLPVLVRIALDAGDAELARRAVEASRAEMELEPLPYKQALYEWCRGLVDGDPEPVLLAGEYFRHAHRPLELGNILEDAADLQAARGETESARAGLAEAVSVYASLGAAWDSQRAAARLRRYGVRLGVRGPRQRPRNGWAALTDTELRVAELVATGMSNPDIAGRLLLSRRTVQTHVSHILGKLGARSRREIAEHARPATG